MKTVTKIKTLFRISKAILLLSPLANEAIGAGILTPVNSADSAIEIQDHQVHVIINNGFAQTRVRQSFFNPNPHDLEAIFSFPVPEHAALSELRMLSNETVLESEVVEKATAQGIYESEKAKGNKTGVANQNDFQNFEFRVSPVAANQAIVMEFVYYEKLEIDSNVGRYVYPLEEGGTDEQSLNFWKMNSAVSGPFSATVELRSSYPVKDIRVPSFGGKSETLENGVHRWTYQSAANTSLDRDLVFYYRLQDGLPGRVDLMTYKEEDQNEGTFMMTITPGTDLKPITQGADYLLVLDKSGSMSGKIQTLANGIEKALKALKPEDRFRIVTFDSSTREITKGWVNVSEESVNRYIESVRSIAPSDGTNLYAGLSRGMQMLDSDRLTNLILITDGVTNTGVVDPKAFDKLMRSRDVRLFGYLMGNSANWPLMRIICEASDGTYDSISNGDDLYGKILLAKDKITTEALLDVELQIKGLNTYDLHRNSYRKIYQGDQLVIIGKYSGSGEADLKMTARITGKDTSFNTSVHFPKQDLSYPELERIYATTAVQSFERMMHLGLIPEKESEDAVKDIGLRYQIVTNETSLLLLDDQRFQDYGIERNNEQRMLKEHQAQIARSNQAPQPTRADTNKPMFAQNTAHSAGNGGGSMEIPFALGILVSISLIARKHGKLSGK